METALDRQPLSPDDPDAEAAAQADPQTREYWKVAGVLAVITFLEFIVVYIPQLVSVMIPVLVILSLIKFILVARVFMHLKNDAPIFSWAMTVGFIMAMAICISIVLVVVFGAGLEGSLS